MISTIRKRWSRAEILATAQSLDTWPSVDFELAAMLGDETGARAQMLSSRVKAIKMFAEGKTYREIRTVTGQDGAMVRNLFRRCLELADDGRIQGYRALLPYVHIRPNVRRSEVREKRQEQQGGMSCALNAILTRLPDLEDKLVKRLKKDKRNEPDH